MILFTDVFQINLSVFRFFKFSDLTQRHPRNSKNKMHRLSLRAEPTVEQEDAWNPDELLEALLSVKDKQMNGKVCSLIQPVFILLGCRDVRI
jgi:hypothetical protein